MINENKQNKLSKFIEWIIELSKKSEYKIKFEDNARKQIAKYHITNPINLKRIKKNIEYIVNDPFNRNKKAPNDWHRLSYTQKDEQVVFTMDINGNDRMAYIVDDNVIIFSLLGHIE